MRLFLDAHISGRRVGKSLRRDGHDVRAANEDRDLDGFADEELFALAAADGRIMVTCDVADFALLARRWAEEDRRHAGCAILVGVDHADVGEIVRRIRRELAARPRHDDWVDLTVLLSRRRIKDGA